MQIQLQKKRDRIRKRDATEKRQIEGMGELTEKKETENSDRHKNKICKKKKYIALKKTVEIEYYAD